MLLNNLNTSKWSENSIHDFGKLVSESSTLFLNLSLPIRYDENYVLKERAGKQVIFRDILQGNGYIVEFVFED